MHSWASAYDTVAFSPDDRLLASAGYESTVRLWEQENGSLIVSMVVAPEGWVAFANDGRYKLGGNPGSVFWYAIGLCRFEPGELDDFLPPGTLVRLGAGEPF